MLAWAPYLSRVLCTAMLYTVEEGSVSEPVVMYYCEAGLGLTVGYIVLCFTVPRCDIRASAGVGCKYCEL